MIIIIMVLGSIDQDKEQSLRYFHNKLLFMKTAPIIYAYHRPATGKRAVNATRRANMLPGVVYGDKLPPVAIAIVANEFTKLLRQQRFASTVFSLQIEGETGKNKPQRVMGKALQRNPLNELPIHADFVRIAKDGVIKIMIPVNFCDESISPGLKRGGILNIVRREIELNVSADNIPEQINVSLGNLDIGDSLHFSAMELPEGASPVIQDRDFTIATITGASVAQEEQEEQEEDEESEEENAPG